MYDDERWEQKIVTEVLTGRQPAQIVWGCIWLDESGMPRRSDLVIIERDPNS
jgi:hypothetical protein